MTHGQLVNQIRLALGDVHERLGDVDAAVAAFTKVGRRLGVV